DPELILLRVRFQPSRSVLWIEGEQMAQHGFGRRIGRFTGGTGRNYSFRLELGLGCVANWDGWTSGLLHLGGLAGGLPELDSWRSVATRSLAGVALVEINSCISRCGR